MINKFFIKHNFWFELDFFMIPFFKYRKFKMLSGYTYNYIQLLIFCVNFDTYE